MDYRQLLVQHLALVDKVVRFVGRRHHLSNADVEEFASFVRFKLVDRDFAILRKFEGRSSINTYLTVVIERLCLDFCVSRWGKWRPTAAARRLGAVAILLEQLIVRDGITFDEAVGTLQTNHGVDATRAELHALFLQLPTGSRRRPPGCTTGWDGEHPASIDNAFDRRDDEHLVARVQVALILAIDGLPPDDRRILRLRFAQNMTVPELARATGLDAKPLYRRLDRIIDALREDLQGRGIEEQEIARIVGHPTLALGSVLADATN